MAKDPRRTPGSGPVPPNGPPEENAPKAPAGGTRATPFAAADDEWESELAEWDASIPIVGPLPTGPLLASAAPLAGSGQGQRDQAAAAGIVSQAENPFVETPITAVSPGQTLDLDDLPDIFSAGTFDDGLAPASGSYAALVATDQSSPGIFDREPPPEPLPSFPNEALREMLARPWSDDLSSLIALGEGGAVTAPPPAHWESLAKVIEDERSLERASERAATLCLAATRVADVLGHSTEAHRHLDALLAIDGSSPVAHRARLGLVERAGSIDGDEVRESLARLAATPHPDQPYYRSLYAEWTLSRTARDARGARELTDGTAAAAVAFIADGLARILGEAELAWRDPPAAAALLEAAGHRVGGGLGAALLLCAAGLNELAQEFQMAADQRFAAARLDESRMHEQSALPSLGVLRDLARLGPEAMVNGLEDFMRRLPPSPLKAALARWGAAAAVRAGDASRAWRIVAEPHKLGPLTPGLARDRLDLRPAWSPPEATASRRDQRTNEVMPALSALTELTEALSRTWTSPTAQVCLALRVSELAATVDERAFALDSIERAASALPDAVALGPAVERLAWHKFDETALSTGSRTAARVRALRLWREIDPARWTAASLALADTLPATATDGQGDSNGEQTRELVLREIAARDATSPAFWELAALAVARGQFAEATAAFDQAVARPAWRDSPLAAPLLELAAEVTARADLPAAAARLAGVRQKSAAQSVPTTASGLTSEPAAPRMTLGRVLRQLGDPDLWAEFVEGEQAGAPIEQQSERERLRRAALLLEPLFWRGGPGRRDQDGEQDGEQDDEDVPALAAAALDVAPLHPAAFALVLGADPDPGLLVERLVAGKFVPGGERWLLAAAITAAVAGDAPRGLRLAAEARGRVMSDQTFDLDRDDQRMELLRSINGIIRRLAWTVTDTQERAAMLRELAEADGSAEALIEAAEATETAMDAAAADASVGPATDGGVDDAAAVLRGEARRLFEAAAFASTDAALATDVRVGLERLAASTGDPGNTRDAGNRRSLAEGGTFRSASGADRRRERDRLRLLETAARNGRWDEVVSALAETPPHQEKPDAATLSLAAAIDEARGLGNRAPQLWVGARAAASGSAADFSIPAPFVREAAALFSAADSGDSDPAYASAALEQLAGAAASAGDHRSAALLLVQAAGLATRLASPPQVDTSAADSPAARQQRCLHAAVAHDPRSALAAIAWRRWLFRSNRLADAANASAAEAEALVDPGLRVRALVRGARLSQAARRAEAGGSLVDEMQGEANGEGSGDAAVFLRRALEIEPRNHEIFMGLRDLYEQAGKHTALADLLATRLGVTSNPFEVTALRLARADIFADALGNRAQAKEELEAILHKEPQHARALARLADLEQEDENYARAADLLIRRAFIERSPEKLLDLFLRLGRIYTHDIPDAKRAVGAYARVLQLDANSREALDELSRLYLGLGETKSAISITERLVRIETVPAVRSRYHIRLAQLAERAGDPRSAALHFRRAAEDAPRDIQALGELVRHLEKVRDTAGRRAYLDRVASDLRMAVFDYPADVSALEALIAVLRWRGRGAAAAAAAELLVLVLQGQGSAEHQKRKSTGGGGAVLPAWATPPAGGRSLAALSRPAVDEETFPPTVPSSVRHLFRLLAPALWEGDKVDKRDLSRYRVDRGNRVAPGRPPRDVFDAVGAELLAGPFDLYLAPVFPISPDPSASPVPRSEASAAAPVVVVAVHPGKPPSIIISASVMQLGPAALRFVAGRSLRLISTHLEGAIAGGPAEVGEWIGAVVRQFMADYRHPLVPPERLAAGAARVGKLLSRKVRQEIMPFAMESSGQLDLEALHAGIRDGANRVGLLASGSLAAALRVVLMLGDPAAAADRVPLPEALARNPEARALLSFALSDAYDDLVKAVE